MTTLLEKIATHKARVVVVGIGYVGLPLVVELANAGFRVTGFDRDIRSPHPCSRRGKMLNGKHHHARPKGVGIDFDDVFGQPVGISIGIHDFFGVLCQGG